MTKNILISVVIFFAAVLMSCSGAGNSDKDKNVKWGYLLPETKGIYYECGDLTGKTGPEGRFEYYEGKNVRFYLGGVELGTVTGQKIVTPFTLAGDQSVPSELSDGAITETEFDGYPGARNRMHFLLAINELYSSGYSNLVETLETMHVELSGKNIDFTKNDFSDFETQLENIAISKKIIFPDKGISLGGLNSISAALISNHVENLNTNVDTYNTTKPGYADDYNSVNDTGVTNPPVDGQILTEDQISGVWIAEWDIYGDRAHENPDSAYRDAYVKFPQKNYFVRFDGGEADEEFVCGEYQTFYTFDKTSKWKKRYVKIDGPIVSKQSSTLANYPAQIYYDHNYTISRPKNDFIGLWERLYNQAWDVEVNGYNKNLYTKYYTNSNYAILEFPNIDDFDDDGTVTMAGFEQMLFSKPVNGRVKVYSIDRDENGVAEPMELQLTIRKVSDNAVAGAQEPFFSVD